MSELTPPEVVLARMLREHDEAKQLVDTLTPYDFVRHDDKQLFLFVANMIDAGETVSPKAVYRKAQVAAPAMLEFIKEIGRIAVSDTIATDVRVVPLTDAVGHFKEWSRRSRLAKVLDDAIGRLEVSDAQFVAQELMAMTERIIAGADNERNHDDIDEQTKLFFQQITSQTPTGVNFGFAALDKAVVPMMYGNMILIGGATGSGKSTVARNIARQLVHAGHKVAIHSLELTAHEQWTNFAVMESGVDVDRAFQTELLSEKEQDDLGRAGMWYREHKRLRINDRSDVSPHQLLQTMKRYEAEGFRIQIIDHLHEVDHESEGDEKKLRVLIGRTAGKLKAFAKNTQSIVIPLVQLVKIDKTIEPNDGHIRESAKIGEEADKILLVFRPEIACIKSVGGALVPQTRSPMSEARVFARELTKKHLEQGAVVSLDDERIYIKLGKQRIRARQGIVSIRYHASSDLMYDRQQ